MKSKTKYLAVLAVFCALSIATLFVINIKVSFLTFEVKMSIVTIGAMIYGPVSAVVMSLAVSLIELFTISDTGLWGLLMNFVATASYSVTASLIYKYKKNLTGAIISLISASIVTTTAMILFNLLITPIYAGCTTQDVVKLIFPLLLPFNIIKAVCSSAVVLILYKPVSTVLKRLHIIQGKADDYRFDRNTIAIIIAGILLLIGCSFALYLIINS